jgi:hypothetical protein
MPETTCPCGCGRRLSRFEWHAAGQWVAADGAVELLERFAEMASGLGLSQAEVEGARRLVGPARALRQALGNCLHHSAVQLDPLLIARLAPRVDRLVDTVFDTERRLDPEWALAWARRQEARALAPPAATHGLATALHPAGASRAPN